MTALWKRLAAQVPVPLLLAWALAGAFMVFVAWDQSHWWQAKEDYVFGWLVPLFVAFVVNDRWPRIVRATEACAAPGSPRATGLLGGLLTVGWGAVAVGGALVFLIGAFYRAGAGPSYPATLALSLGTAAITLALVFLHAPAPGSWTPAPVAPEPGAGDKGARAKPPAPGAAALEPSGLERWDARFAVVGFFVFPALVWLVSAPMVSRIENNLSLFLLGQVTHVVFFVFDILGLPIEQRGNILVLPTGEVGVAEACSGIRSLTACLFAGSFLAAVFLEQLWKKVTLVATAMVLAIFTNLLRSLFLTAYAYNFGPEAIEGFVHDAAGYAVLGLTVIGLLCLLKVFSFFSPPPDEPGDTGAPPPPGATAVASAGGAGGGAA